MAGGGRGCGANDHRGLEMICGERCGEGYCRSVECCAYLCGSNFTLQSECVCLIVCVKIQLCSCGYPTTRYADIIHTHAPVIIRARLAPPHMHSTHAHTLIIHTQTLTLHSRLTVIMIDVHIHARRSHRAACASLHFSKRLTLATRAGALLGSDRRGEIRCETRASPADPHAAAEDPPRRVARERAARRGRCRGRRWSERRGVTSPSPSGESLGQLGRSGRPRDHILAVRVAHLPDGQHRI